MSSEDHKFLYKYHKCTKPKQPEQCLVLQSLFSNQAMVSTRTQYNDPFDTRIRFQNPKKLKELKKAAEKINKKAKIIYNGKTTLLWNEAVENFSNYLNTIFDQYRFYCLSSATGTEECTLMWAHYADNHQGFCIKFHKQRQTHGTQTGIPAERVKYLHNTKIAVLPFVKTILNNHSNIECDLKDNNGGEIFKYALLTKSKQWEYEEEYRYIAANAMYQNMKPCACACECDKNCAQLQRWLMEYKPEWVHSIVFGSRMDESVKDYIKQEMLKKMPNINFEQARCCYKKHKVIIEPVSAD